MNAEAVGVKVATPLYRPGADARDVLTGFKRTDVGVIPDDWATHSLGEIGHCLIGLTYEPSNVRPDGLLVLRASNIGDGGLQFGDDVFVDVDVPERLLVRPGDLLICVRNGSRRLIGKCTLLDCRVEGMTFGAFMSVFRSKDNHFVAYCFQSHIIKSQIRRHLGATINQITNKSLKSFEVPFPPLSERRAIAAALSDVDALLDGLDQLIAKKRDLKQATMQQLLTGRTRLPDCSEKWVTVQLGDISHVKTGDRNHEDKEDGGRFPFFVRSERVERIDSFSYDCEAIIVPGEGNIGSILHYVSGRFDLHQRVYKVSDFPDYIHGKFVYFAMAHGFGSHAMRNTVKATVDSLRLPTFLSFQLQVPSTIYEQRAIATILSDMDVEITALEARRDKTRDLKQAMMQELLTGRTRLVQPEVAHA